MYLIAIEKVAVVIEPMVGMNTEAADITDDWLEMTEEVLDMAEQAIYMAEEVLDMAEKVLDMAEGNYLSTSKNFEKADFVFEMINA